MLRELKQGLLFTVATMLLLGFGYHLVLWGFGQALFPEKAAGSLIRRSDGAVIGSRLIAQNFARDEA
jgi:K+-transporting ATPase ATPase C chain